MKNHKASHSFEGPVLEVPKLANDFEVQCSRSESSIRVFRRFLTSKHKSDGTVEYDASRIISKECYLAWVASRNALPTFPEKIFQRSLTSHITATDSRQPFQRDEEVAILIVVRQRKVWLVYFLLVCCCCSF